MKAAIGSTVSQRTSYPIDASDIRRWAIAVYWPGAPPAVFWDEAAARASSSGGLIAPEEFNPFAWMAADEGRDADTTAGSDVNRLERALGIAGPDLSFQLNGGLEATYGERMRPGDVITSTTRLADYRERPGRLGTMLFTTTEDHWVNQHGATVKRARMTLIRY